jgi:hypothetical protein
MDLNIQKEKFAPEIVPSFNVSSASGNPLLSFLLNHGSNPSIVGKKE